MDIKEILKQYAGHSLLKGLAAQVADPQIRSIQVCGACASSPVASGIARACPMRSRARR